MTSLWASTHGACGRRFRFGAGGGDVTGEHYIGKSATELRKGWQAVADFIDAEAAATADEMPSQSEP